MSSQPVEAESGATPLACVPGAIAPGDRAAHFALASQLFTVALRQRRAMPNGYAYRFDPDVVGDLLQWVANERRCCPFLTFALEITASGGPVWVSVTGPEGTRAFLDAELPPVSASVSD